MTRLPGWVLRLCLVAPFLAAAPSAAAAEQYSVKGMVVNVNRSGNTFTA